MVTKNWEPLLTRQLAFKLAQLRRSVYVRVRAGIGHGEQEGLAVLPLEVFIGELLAVDGAAAGTLRVRVSSNST